MMVFSGISIPIDGAVVIKGDKFFDFELMQFTGLKDKNGKEIYEGDILEYVERDWNKLKDLTVRCDVVFEDGAFKPSIDPENSEVIGNIYENPELLK